MAAIGVRSSWDASATNRRSRCSESRSRRSEASRALKADSMRVSMTLRVRASRPTSVVSFSPGTRSVRLPSAMDSAVRSMSRSGRSPIRTSQKPPEQGHHHGRAGHDQLHQEQMVEGAPDVAQRLGHDEHVPVGRASEALHPERPVRPAWLDGAVKYVDLGAVRTSSSSRLMVGGNLGACTPCRPRRPGSSGRRRPRPEAVRTSSGGHLDRVGRWSWSPRDRPRPAHRRRAANRPGRRTRTHVAGAAGRARVDDRGLRRAAGRPAGRGRTASDE